MPMLIEIVGWSGAATLLVAFGLVSYGLIDARRRAYQALNILGGLLLAANSGWHDAWPSAALNLVWSAIAVGALIVAATQHRRAPEQANTKA